MLLVFCHPRADSYAAALRDATVRGLQRAGHAVEVRDLHAEGFRPGLTAEEHARVHEPGANLEGVEDHAASLRAADALVLVYPTWWYGMPATLKGWFDRVWVTGLAFTLGAGAIESALTNIRRIAVVTTYGSPLWLLWWIGWPDRRVMGRAIRRLCAPRCRLEWHALTDMDHRARPALEAHLARVEAAFARWRDG